MRSIRFFIPFLMGCFVVPGFAQDAGIRVGESRLSPAIQIEFGTSDNAFRRSEDEVDEQFVVLKPSLDWRADKGVTEVEASYEGAFKAGDLEETEYIDSIFSGRVSTEFNRRSRIEAEARLSFEHLELGEDVFTRIDPDAFDQVEFFRQIAGVTYTFGARQARGQIRASLEVDNLDYSNNDIATSGSSRVIVSPAVEFSFRASQDTRVFLTVGIDEVIRTEDGNSRTDLDAAVGSRWEITGRTGGFAQIGVSTAALDGAEDNTSVTLEAGLFYQPRSFSRFDFTASRGFFNDGSGTLTEAAVLNALSVRWRHDWSSRVFHLARFAYRNVERECPDVDDETADLRFEIGVQVRRWICLLYTSPSPRDATLSRMPSSA